MTRHERHQTGRMISKAVEYYQLILTSRSWYAEGLSWTVIQPASRQPTVAEVMRRLHAERVNLDELDEWADDPDPLLVAHLAQIGPHVVMFQDNGFEGSRPEVLRRLSDGARVHNVDWTITGNGSLSYAVYGKVLTRIDMNDPGRKYGEDPTALDEDLAGMHTARQALDREEQADPDETSQAVDPSVPSGPDKRLIAEAAAMAHRGTPYRHAAYRAVAGQPRHRTVAGRHTREDPFRSARPRSTPSARAERLTAKSANASSAWARTVATHRRTGCPPVLRSIRPPHPRMPVTIGSTPSNTLVTPCPRTGLACGAPSRNWFVHPSTKHTDDNERSASSPQSRGTPQRRSRLPRGSPR
ncbi:DUF6461 domain-containing protein [Nonomuraea polychroma]|uniref:DUF6461 domain-containing protein n=1 Tax=Nonomuraea polychroma TaxID=46176 RepID=UPI000FDDB7CA|nr:DUF6461 domain-containing protein [Nonomuraea polychroma]